MSQQTHDSLQHLSLSFVCCIDGGGTKNEKHKLFVYESETFVAVQDIL